MDRIQRSDHLIFTEEALKDGKQYGRKDEQWVEIAVQEAPMNGVQYLRKDGAWDSFNQTTMVTSVTSDASVVIADGQRKILTANTGKTVTLPDSTDDGKLVSIVNETSTQCVVNCTGTYTFIDGSTSGIMQSAGESWDLISDFTNKKWLLT